ncbi:MAG: VWA domain-containing protein [Spirochaetes bacterium]|nr:VWA domain-containing protein [Spirochaetota bacterium]
MILALARPQAGQRSLETEMRGIDIMLALDISGSMMAEDFKPNNRLTVAKKVLSDFVKGRKTDRMGLVIFAGESFTQSPLTFDYNIILDYLKQIRFGMIDDGTAIGMALANCVNRLKPSRAKSKVIILLTDGENNSGLIDPVTAAQAASAMNIKIYTVGVGKLGGAPIPFFHPRFGKQYFRNEDGSFVLTKLDEKTLKEIAFITSGKYFRATDAGSLKRIYQKIDSLEKTKIKARQFFQYNELFGFLLWIALFFILCYIVLENIIFIKVP